LNAWMSRARPTAIATVTTSSMSDLTVDFGAFVVDLAIGCRLEEAEPAGRPVGEDCPPDAPSLGNRAPEPAVLGVWTIVAHHVVLIGRNPDRAGKVARPRAVAGHRVRVALGHAVADHVPVVDRDA